MRFTDSFGKNRQDLLLMPDFIESQPSRTFEYTHGGAGRGE